MSAGGCGNLRQHYSRALRAFRVTRNGTSHVAVNALLVGPWQSSRVSAVALLARCCGACGAGLRRLVCQNEFQDVIHVFPNRWQRHTSVMLFCAKSRRREGWSPICRSKNMASKAWHPDTKESSLRWRFILGEPLPRSPPRHPPRNTCSCGMQYRPISPRAAP